MGYYPQKNPMKKILFAFFLIFIIISLFAEQDAYLKDVFEKAKAMIHKNDFVSVYTQLSEKYPDHIYGQKAFLELGKIALLERKYEEAIVFLKKIYNKEITEKEYWLAKVYFQAGEYHYAILSAQNYIFDSHDHGYIEESYFIISESYMMQKLYKRALNTLDYLRQSSYIKNHIPLLFYQMVVCNINLKEYEQANLLFKKLRTDFPYDYYTFLAEEEIYNSTISGEFYVSSAQNLPLETSPEIGTTPMSYLQVGAFSAVENAKAMVKKINSLGLEGITFQKKSGGKVLFVAAAGPFSEQSALEKAKKLLENHDIPSIVIKR
jgi:tetratricopeptide (TPR) repeat protein